jgi:selenide,water dikinase
MIVQDPIRLTSLASCAGCAAKIGPAVLSEILQPLAQFAHPDLLVGLQTSDDAAVYRLTPDLALVQTIDFFTPIVDDPWAFGAIAAANSMSDVYAMGGRVLMALNVSAFPDDLPPTVISTIFAGAMAKVTEAGGVIAGGHTITDREPKFGLSVTGLVHPDHIWTKAGAQPGDQLFLTKPIGTGIVVTAAKADAAREEDLAAATESMLTLNAKAAQAASNAGGIHAATDVTGFSLLGHANEMAQKSVVELRICAGSVPLLPGVPEYAAGGFVAGGLHRNRAHFEHSLGQVEFADGIDELMRTILFDPQTSGGLLLAVDPSRANTLAEQFGETGLPIWHIGSVAAGTGVTVT